MDVPQSFHLIVTDSTGAVINLTTGKVMSNEVPSANSIAGGEVGVSFSGQIVSSETQLCFIPNSEDDDITD